jgi:hypothetical protein
MLHPLAHRTGLRYDYAVIRPMWKRDKAVLRLEKYLENWMELHPDDIEPRGVSSSRIVCEDVSQIPDEKLSDMLDDLHCELIPEDCEEEDGNA